MNEPVIVLEGVSLHYRRQHNWLGGRDHRVLEDVGFSIYAGETLGIIGRNGAGKTSLLKLIAGLIKPDTGTITSNAGRVCLLTYQLGFNKFLSGRENAIHTAMLQGMSRREIVQRMGEVVSFAGLEDMIDEPISSYSAGMRARLGFSVSLILDPDVLLVDEALGVGDHEFKKRSSAAMRARMKSQKTVVMVSHDPFSIKDLCDRAVWIVYGFVVAVGTASAVLDHYDSLSRGNG